MISRTISGLLAAVLFCAVAWCGSAGDRHGKYSSDRSQHKFLGATRIVLTDFDAAAKDAKSAMLQLDMNDVVFSTYGDSRITTVFFKPFEVKLTPLTTLTFYLTPSAVFESVARPARTVAASTSLEEANTALNALGIKTELDLERERARQAIQENN